jgi:hypothetical protein
MENTINVENRKNFKVSVTKWMRENGYTIIYMTDTDTNLRIDYSSDGIRVICVYDGLKSYYKLSCEIFDTVNKTITTLITGKYLILRDNAELSDLMNTLNYQRNSLKSAFKNHNNFLNKVKRWIQNK